MRQAVVDVGSNSLLLAVGERAEGGVRPVFEATRVTGLGEGVKASGRLSEEPMRRSLAALAELFELARSKNATRTRAAATMAVRIAENAAEFLERAREQRTPVEVLSGQDEARFGFQAVVEDPFFSGVSELAVVDPGGNSTELVLAERQGQAWKERFRKSFPIGTLGLRDGLLREERLTPESLLRASGELDARLATENLPQIGGTAVVLGATGTNLVTIRERMAEWDPDRVHGQILEYEEIGRAVGWLAGMTDAERSQVAGIEPGREKTIHIGALILERFLYALRQERAVVSVRGWRHAMLAEMFRSEAKASA
jgi:exopolyphosphatase / guanosine-5'-triphosphate,3'-diphosphate pyrophosphatase